MSYRLDAKNLRFSVGTFEILKNISLSLQSGELVALLGPSGSGKSTLLKAMIAFKPADGTVEICGEDLYSQIDSLKARIGYVPQDDILHRSLKVDRALQYTAMLRLPELDSDAIDARVKDVMDRVGLTERSDTKVKALSGGQRKRVSVAMELLAEPPLLFMDEPTSGLDPALEEQMMDLFRELTSANRITVVTTHVLASLAVVDVVIVIAKGELVFVGPPGELKSFFAAEDLPDVYRILIREGPGAWRRKFEGSSLFSEFVLDRLATPPPPLPGRTTPGA